jgi:phage repressor protein C with HTH and peptisase S24 domain
MWGNIAPMAKASPENQPATPLVRAIDAHLAKTGLSARALSLKVSENETLVRQIKSGRSKTPRADTLRNLARELGVPVDALLAEGESHLPDTFHPESDVQPARDVPPRQPRRVASAEQVPVMGTAEGGENGFFELNLAERPVEYVDRPPALQGVEQGELFAIRVAGTSMEPVWGPDDLVFIVKSRQPKPDAYVVALVERGPGDQPRALLKQLVKKDDEWVVLRQHNPAKEVKLPRNQVRHMWRALHWRDLGL